MIGSSEYLRSILELLYYTGCTGSGIKREMVRLLTFSDENRIERPIAEIMFYRESPNDGLFVICNSDNVLLG